MKILVTGGCGLLGASITNHLSEYEAIALDRDVSPRGRKVNGYKIVGDCYDREGMAQIVDGVKPEVVIHLAAESIIKDCDDNPANAIDTNLTGLTNMLLASREVERFVFISSSFVYGDFQYTPTEGHPKNPKGIYGGTKYAGEILTKTFCNRYGIEWVIVRPSAVYGATDINKRVVQVLLENALQGKPLVLEGANSKLDFTYLDDAVEGICLASLSGFKNEAFNITRGEGRSLTELAGIIQNLIPCEIIEGKENGLRPKRGALDITAARCRLGYNPQWSLENGVKKYLEWMMAQ